MNDFCRMRRQLSYGPTSTKWRANTSVTGFARLVGKAPTHHRRHSNRHLRSDNRSIIAPVQLPALRTNGGSQSISYRVPGRDPASARGHQTASEQSRELRVCANVEIVMSAIGPACVKSFSHSLGPDRTLAIGSRNTRDRSEYQQSSIDKHQTFGTHF